MKASERIRIPPKRGRLPAGHDPNHRSDVILGAIVLVVVGACIVGIILWAAWH